MAKPEPDFDPDELADAIEEVLVEYGLTKADSIADLLDSLREEDGDDED